MSIDRQREHETEADDDRADAELLGRIRDADREALHALYRKYYHPLLRFTYRLTGQLEIAQETVNDVMLVVWRDAASFEGRSKVATWIMGIAYRKAMKRVRCARLWSVRYITPIDERIERFPSEEAPTERVELEDLLDRALEALSAEQRAVVELTYFFGCSYDEIAKIVGCPVNTVKTRMFHARAKLKSLLPRLGKDSSK
ncbi:MAG: sigma-70 family RNA polymerase sigma factor [Gammaproteobacteria bacterium]